MAQSLTDSELIKMRKDELTKDKEDHIIRIKEIKISRKRLDQFLLEAQSFKPPTKEHVGFKEFIIKQLKSTIDYDGDHSYSEQSIITIDSKLDNLNADNIKNSLIESSNKDIAYHLKHHNEDIKRCDDSNKWVQDLLGALI